MIPAAARCRSGFPGLLVAVWAVLAGCGGQNSVPRPVGAVGAAASAWPEAFGDAAHSSPAGARGPQTAHLKWRVNLGGTVTPGPVIGTDGSILAASNAGVLHALNPANGNERWRFDGGTSYGNDLSTSPAVLGDGTILWPGPENALYALSGTGKLLWSQHFAGFVLSPAIGTGRRVYIADMAGHLTAIDVGPSGKHTSAWTISTGANSYGSPAIAADGTIYTTAGRKLFAIGDDTTHAKIRWTFTAKDDIEVSPAVAPDGTVILGTNNDVEYAITPAGHPAWTFPKGHYSYSSPVVRGGNAYFGDHLGDLDVIDVSSGAVIRRDTTLSRSPVNSSVGIGIWTAPLVDAAGDVYFGTAAGHLYGYRPDGRRLWDINTGAVNDSYPALTADGTLVIGGGNTLYAVGG